MEQLAPRHQVLKRHEASSWAPRDWRRHDGAHCRTHFSLQRYFLLPPRLGCDRRVSFPARLTAALTLAHLTGTAAEAGGRIFMSDSFIIEVRSEAAGIVVRDGGGFRFYAASRAFDPLEGRMFNTPRDAEKAALRQATARPSQGHAKGREAGARL